MVRRMNSRSSSYIVHSLGHNHGFSLRWSVVGGWLGGCSLGEKGGGMGGMREVKGLGFLGIHAGIW